MRFYRLCGSVCLAVITPIFKLENSVGCFVVGLLITLILKLQNFVGCLVLGKILFLQCASHLCEQFFGL